MGLKFIKSLYNGNIDIGFPGLTSLWYIETNVIKGSMPWDNQGYSQIGCLTSPEQSMVNASSMQQLQLLRETNLNNTTQRDRQSCH